MGASTYNSVRLHISVWPKPPSLWRGSPDSSKQRIGGFCATSGTLLPTTKGSNRESTSVGPETRLFQSLLSCTKEGRWSTTHSGPASSEALLLQREVQDVDIEDYYVPGSSGRLVCHCRPRNAYFHIQVVRRHRKALPVQSSSLWPGLALDLRKFTKCMDAALAPLMLQGICVFNYLYD